ncbi:UDP-2,4-diacetamido-2,4,6-trideoxy-beta-L-altropyranose hydrolase [Nitratifractor sp.]
MSVVLFRADSSSKIGTGHIMRDLVLARREFSDSRVIFAVRDLPGNINQKIREAGYEIRILASHDVAELISLAREVAAETIVIDHYGIDIDEERRIKEATGAELFVLDDTYRAHDCDILLNHNLYADAKRYDGRVPSSCRILCGPAYTLLREEFISAKKERKEQNHDGVRRLFLAMGGSDPLGLILPILKVLSLFPEIVIDVATTSANERVEQLTSYARRHPCVQLHIDSEHIAALIARADLAVVSASVILNEVHYLGVPYIAIKTAENQKEMLEFLERNSAPLLAEFDPYRLFRMLEEKIRKAPRYTTIDFPAMDESQKRRVLEWRNDPKVRKWMYNRSPISWKDHLRWIEGLRDQETRRYWLVQRAESDIGIIDLVDIDPKSKRANIGLYADPERRGEGVFLMLILMKKAEEVGLKTLRAEVFAENLRAIQLYRFFGFEEQSLKRVDGREIIVMERAL